ncbi:MAG: restriction endonuclease subunit S [Nitrosomonas ureae]
MSFPRYPIYKDSGVEWLGEVPAHWDVMPVKNLASIVNGYPFDSTFFDSAEGYPLIRIRDLNKFEAETYYKGEFVETAAITSADVLIGMDGDFNVGRWRGQGRALLNQRMCCVRGRSNLATRLLEYSLPIRLKEINDVTYATTVKHLASSQVEKTFVAIPPDTAEQSKIASFLDRETAKIDELVAEQRRLMELLKEKRQAVISHAVTKGLNPDAPMKPSGIEWMGAVPAHWEVKRISSLSTKITNGFVGPTRDILADSGIRYLQSLHIKGNTIRFEVPYFVAEEWSNQHRKSILETGDVLIVQTGDIGQTAVVTEEFAGCNCHALIIVAPLRPVVDGEWMSWALNSDYGFHTLISIQTGALHPHLNCGNVKDISIPLPSIAEQLRIVEYIKEQIHGFDTLTAEAQRAIDLLQERRAALISAAVTGSIDIRGFA